MSPRSASIPPRVRRCRKVGSRGRTNVARSPRRLPCDGDKHVPKPPRGSRHPARCGAPGPNVLPSRTKAPRAVGEDGLAQREDREAPAPSWFKHSSTPPVPPLPAGGLARKFQRARLPSISTRSSCTLAPEEIVGTFIESALPLRTTRCRAAVDGRWSELFLLLGATVF